MAKSGSPPPSHSVDLIERRSEFVPLFRIPAVGGARVFVYVSDIQRSLQRLAFSVRNEAVVRACGLWDDREMDKTLTVSVGTRIVMNPTPLRFLVPAVELPVSIFLEPRRDVCFVLSAPLPVDIDCGGWCVVSQELR